MLIRGATLVKEGDSLTSFVGCLRGASAPLLIIVPLSWKESGTKRVRLLKTLFLVIVVMSGR
jgi:hypothetical protein